MALTKKYIKKAAVAVLFSLLLTGCGQQVSFEKIDYKGHVRVENEGGGYCFKIPKDWEIRLKLEGSDVVCLAPTSSGFRESIVATAIPGSKLTDPGEAVKKQLGVLGNNVEVLEPWSESDKPVVVTLAHSEFSEDPLGQMLFLHLKEDGSGVLLTCTTTKSALEERREFFSSVAESAKYNLDECTGPGGVPKVFPTPEVTFSPKPS